MLETTFGTYFVIVPSLIRVNLKFLFVCENAQFPQKFFYITDLTQYTSCSHLTMWQVCDKNDQSSTY